MNFARLLRSDRAENSIMQTITIAVSAILIAAGLVTAPGLINNARDNNARTDLANIAYGQEFALSDVGHYFRYITPEAELAATGSNVGNNLIEALGGGSATTMDGAQGGLKFTLSGNVTGHQAATCDESSFYVLKARSSSGKWFYRASGSGATSQNLSDLTIPAEVIAACPTIIDDFEEDPTVVTPPANTAGVAVIDDRVNNTGSIITGYGTLTEAQVESFGGGDEWYTAENSEVELSYSDGAGGFVPFYTYIDDWSGSFIELRYNEATGQSFSYYNSETNGTYADEFLEIYNNGGRITFTADVTGAEITVLWAPAIGDTPTNQPVWNDPPNPGDGTTGDNGDDTTGTPVGADNYYSLGFSGNWNDVGDAPYNYSIGTLYGQSIDGVDVKQLSEFRNEVKADGGFTTEPRTWSGNHVYLYGWVEIEDNDPDVDNEWEKVVYATADKITLTQMEEYGTVRVAMEGLEFVGNAGVDYEEDGIAAWAGISFSSGGNFINMTRINEN